MLNNINIKAFPIDTSSVDTFVTIIPALIGESYLKLHFKRLTEWPVFNLYTFLKKKLKLFHEKI